jgi:hypothetical protein
MLSESAIRDLKARLIAIALQQNAICEENPKMLQHIPIEQDRRDAVSACWLLSFILEERSFAETEIPHCKALQPDLPEIPK